jgi:hypothetical protein
MAAMKKYVDISDKVMLPHSWIKLTEVPLFILYVVVCIETSTIQVCSPKVSRPCIV